MLSLRRRCIDVLTLGAGYANPLRSKILFFTKWCSRLSAVLIFQNDSFQKIEFGLVCVTPTAQNCVFMLFSMFFFIVIIIFLLLASTPCLFLQYIHASQDDTKDDSKLSQLVVALGCLLGPWLPQAPSESPYRSSK